MNYDEMVVDDNSSLIEIPDDFLNELSENIDDYDSEGEFDELAGEKDIEVDDFDRNAKKFYAMDNQIAISRKQEEKLKEYIKIVNVLLANNIIVNLTSQTNQLIKEKIVELIPIKSQNNEVDIKIITAAIVFTSLDISIVSYVDLLIKKKYFTINGHLLSVLKPKLLGKAETPLREMYVNMIKKINKNIVKKKSLLSSTGKTLIFPIQRINLADIQVPKLSSKEYVGQESLMNFNIIKNFTNLLNIYSDDVFITGVDEKYSKFLSTIKKDYRKQLAVYNLKNIENHIHLTTSTNIMDGYYEKYLNVIEVLNKQITLEISSSKKPTLSLYKKILKNYGFDSAGMTLKTFMLFMTNLKNIESNLKNRNYSISKIYEEMALLKYNFTYKIDKLQITSKIDKLLFSEFVFFNNLFDSIVDFYLSIDEAQKIKKSIDDLTDNTKKINLNKRTYDQDIVSEINYPDSFFNKNKKTNYETDRDKISELRKEYPDLFIKKKSLNDLFTKI